MFLNLLLVSCGGFIGSIARFWIANVLQKNLIGTWIANITGSLLLAIFFRLYINDLISDLMWLACGVGFCGAYTTFSTFGKETISLLIDKKYTVAAMYALSSFTISFILVAFVLIW